MNADKQMLRDVAKKYKQPSDKKGLWAIAASWGWLFFYGVIIKVGQATLWWQLPIALDVVVYLFCAYRIAYHFRALECLIHEASHGTLFATGAWNRNIFMQALYAYIVWRPVQIFTKSHTVHHDQQGNRLTDPDEIQNARWGLHTLHIDSAIVKAWKLVFRQLIGWQSYYYLRYCFLSFFDDATIAVKLGGRTYKIPAWVPTTAYWAVIATIVFVTGAWLIFLLVYAFPFFVLTPIIRFYAEAPEHTGAGIELGNYFRSARNRPGWLNSWALHPFNDAYHQPHHTLKPFVPWFNLPAAYAEMQLLAKQQMEELAIDQMWAIESAIKNGCSSNRGMVVSQSPLATLHDMANVY